MNFSRRKPMQPFPPLPERMKTLASSRNFIVESPEKRRGNGEPFPLRYPIGWERLFSSQCRRREHVHLDLAARAGAEGHHAVGGGEEGVVAADRDVLTRVHLGAALADQ